MGKSYDGANKGTYTESEWINGKLCSVLSANNSRYTAVQWVEGEILSIQAILEAAGLNLKGIHLVSGSEISSNDLQVIGKAKLNGKKCFFIAVLPSEYSQ